MPPLSEAWAQTDWSNARAPDAVLDRLKQGSLAAAMARQSGSSVSRANIRGLHGDASQALLTLSQSLGVELPQILPSEEKLRVLFRDAEVVESLDADGRKLRHRVVILRRRWLVLILVLGSATKITAQRQSPVAVIVADIVARIGPAILWAKRIDRFLRHDWAAAPLMIEMRSQETWIGDSRHGLRFLEGPNEIMLFWEFAQAKEHAQVIAAASLSGQRERTGTKLVEGRVLVGAARVAPPGFARVKLRDGAGIGATAWVLDTPEVLELVRDDVAVGLPACRTDAGDPADQVANVRFALSKIGRERWPDNRIGTELRRRGYSTDRYRARNGADAINGTGGAESDDARPGAVLRSLLDNLDLYETGRLEVPVGSGETVEIEDLFPLDGTWADAADFARIRSELANRKESSTGVPSLALSGLECEVDGVESVLRKAGRNQVEDGCGDQYVATRGDLPTGSTRRPPTAFKIGATRLAEIIRDAIASAGERAVALVPHDEPDETVTRLQRELSDLRRQRAVAIADRDAVEDELEGRGGYTPTGHRKQQLNNKYNRLYSEVEEGKRQEQTVERDLDDRRALLRAQSTPVRVHQLLQLVDSLSDPTDVTWREVWLKALRSVHFTTEPVEAGGLHGTDVHVEGILTVGDTSQYAIPFSGSQRSSIHDTARRRVDAIVEMMRSGIPFDDCDVPLLTRVRPLVAERFGAETNRFPLGACEDPRVLRIAVPLLIDGASPEAVAARNGEPVSLVGRVADLYTAPAFSHMWLVRRSRLLERIYVLAEQSRGVVSYAAVEELGHSRQVFGRAIIGSGNRDRWEVVRGQGRISHHVCGPCGGRRLASLVTPEPAGRVCLDCRLDEAGVAWPSDPYDRYLAFPDLWC